MSEIVKITKITGTAVSIRGNDIDTDRIIPARYLKEVTFARMGDYPFLTSASMRRARKRPSVERSGIQGRFVLFVNKNFGCGSSREHAPQALYRFGIQAIVGESFAAIFAGNCTIMGVPTVTVSAKDMEQLMKSVEENPRTEYAVDLESKTLSYGNHKIAIDLPESYRNALTTGSWDSTSFAAGQSRTGQEDCV